MDNINKEKPIELYSTLPFFKKLKRNIKNWFIDKILHFKMPWRKLIVLFIFLVFIGIIYLFVRLNASVIPVRPPYDKTNFVACDEYIDQMGNETVLENNNYKLVFNNKETTFYIYDKNTDQYWYSNPDTSADRFLNPIELYYSGSLGKIEEIDVLDQAVDYDDYFINTSENSLEVLYYVGGKKEIDSDDFPAVISDERMQELILSKLEEGSIEYRRITEQAYVSGEINGVKIWKLKDGIQRSILKELYRIIYDVCGYTKEDLLYDQQENGIIVKDKYPYFEIAVRYELTNDGLTVTLVNDSIVEKENYPLIYIDVLPYFGAGTLDDEGYMMIPDGSGALIRFNNDRSFALPYNKRIYGYDYAEYYDTKVNDTPQIRLPVIGIKKNDYGFISIIEKGASMTNIVAYNSSDDNPYNQVYYRYNIREGEKYIFTSINSSVSINEWTDEYNSEDFVSTYRFINDDSVTYNEMADTYRDYLIENNILEDKDNTNLPTVDLTLLGGYNRIDNFIGIPYETIKSLTNTDEVLEISNSLINDGITNLNIIYKGFANEGLKPFVMDKIKYDRNTGSKSDFIELQKELSNLNINFYPEVYINTAYTDKFIDVRDEVVRDVFGKTVFSYDYNPATQYQDTTTRKCFTLKPDTYGKTLTNLEKQLNDINVSNVAYADLGNKLTGSYNHNDVIFRNESQAVTVEVLSSTGFKNTIFINPNLYAIPYVSSVIGVDNSSSNYQIITSSIPFYQLVFSGYIDYSSSPINTSDEHSKEYNIMKMIETESNISMEWSYKTTIELTDTEFSIYYSTYYLNWYETLIDIYNTLSNLGIYNARLKNHEILSDDGMVVKSTYSNGTTIIFNYKSSDYLYGTNTIPGNDYLVIEEG